MNQQTAQVLKSAFSFIEVLIVVVLIGLITLPILITYQNSRANRALYASAEQFVNTATSVHIFAREARDKKDWGIRNTSDTTYEIVTSTAASTQTYQKLSLEPGIKFVDSFDISFGIGTGETDSDYSVTLVNKNGIEATVDVLKTGVVELDTSI